MKKLLLAFYYFMAPAVAGAQTQIRADQVIADKGLFPGVYDTVAAPGRLGEIRFRAADLREYQCISLTAGTKRWIGKAKVSDLPSAYTFTAPVINTTGIVSLNGISGYGSGGRKFLTTNSGNSALEYYALPNYATQSALDDTANAIRNDFPTGGSSNYRPIMWAVRGYHDETKSTNLWASKAYQTGVNYKNFFYEAWVIPLDSAEYFISTGYGGHHLVLLGVTAAGPGKFRITGNAYYNGSPVITFSSMDTLYAGKLYNIAVVGDGTRVTTLLNGIPTATQSYSGYRNCMSDPADLDLFILGSDHSKWAGWMFGIRGWEGFDEAPPVSTTTCFAGKRYWQNSKGYYFMYNFTTPQTTINNYGIGLHGNPLHVVLNNSANFNEGSQQRTDSAQLPQWEQKMFWQYPYIGYTPVIAAGSIVSDGFTRQDRNSCFPMENTGAVVPDLDSTEGGSAGKKKWKMHTVNADYYAGIQTNAAYFALDNYAYVDSIGSPDDSIVVTLGAGSHKNVRVVARRADANNYLRLQYYDGYFYLTEIVAGVETGKGSFAFPGSLSTITLVVKDGLAQVYTDATHQIVDADISAGATTADAIGVGALGGGVHIAALVRVTNIVVYDSN